MLQPFEKFGRAGRETISERVHGETHAMRNERQTREPVANRKKHVPYFEKEEATTFSQGGTYDQYRRWIDAYPNLCRVCSFTAILVRRSRANDGASSQAQGPGQDQ